MAGYRTEVDIANRALVHCRVPGIDRFDNQNHNAVELAFVYDKMRIAELTNNLWAFSTKNTVLRAIDTVVATLETDAQVTSGTVLTFASTTNVQVGQVVAGTNIASGSTVVSFVADTSVTLSIAVTGTVALGAAITFGPLTLLYTPPAYAAGTTYAIGHIVTYGGEWWQSKVASNLANTPAQGDYWRRYTGPDTMQAWNDDTDYFAGDLVLGSDGIEYLSLVNNNTDHDPTATTGFWLTINGTTSSLQIMYPLGTGPSSQSQTGNVYRLPRGFLRIAPVNPKGDVGMPLGVLTGPYRDDWVVQNGYIVSYDAGPIFFRYVADFIDVPEMDVAFIEMLAAKIADAVAPQLAESANLRLILTNVGRHYATSRTQAVLNNSILTGPIATTVDSLITCRY